MLIMNKSTNQSVNEGVSDIWSMWYSFQKSIATYRPHLRWLWLWSISRRSLLFPTSSLSSSSSTNEWMVWLGGWFINECNVIIMIINCLIHNNNNDDDVFVLFYENVAFNELVIARRQYHYFDSKLGFIKNNFKFTVIIGQCFNWNWARNDLFSGGNLDHWKSVSFLNQCSAILSRITPTFQQQIPILTSFF